MCQTPSLPLYTVPVGIFDDPRVAVGAFTTVFAGLPIDTGLGDPFDALAVVRIVETDCSLRGPPIEIGLGPLETDWRGLPSDIGRGTPRDRALLTEIGLGLELLLGPEARKFEVTRPVTDAIP